MPQLTAEEMAGWSKDRLQAEYDKRLDRVGAIREGAGGSLVHVVGAEADEVRNLMADTNALGARLDDARAMEQAEQRMASRQIPGVTAAEQFGIDQPDGRQPAGAAAAHRDGPSDLGGLFLASDAWKAFREEGAKGATVSLPHSSLWAGHQGIGEVGAATFTTADFPSERDFRPAPVERLFQANNIGPLMPQGTTNAATVRYPVETVTATGAAAVAEGTAKPEAAITFTPTDEPVRKIAVWLPLTDEAVDDEPFLRAYINARLRLFVENEEDRQLLDGNGGATPPQIVGLLRRSGINVATSYSIGGTNPDQALIDSVFKAAMRVRESFLIPDATVMRSSTWEIARLAKDANRNYLLGPPGEMGEARLWGLRVVLNENMPAQAATNRPVLVGAFASAAMVIRRSGIELAVSDSHANFFTENKLAIRAEERLALAVFRPAGFAVVTSAV